MAIHPKEQIELILEDINSITGVTDQEARQMEIKARHEIGRLLNDVPLNDRSIAIKTVIDRADNSRVLGNSPASRQTNLYKFMKFASNVPDVDSYLDNHPLQNAINWTAIRNELVEEPQQRKAPEWNVQAEAEKIYKKYGAQKVREIITHLKDLL